MLQRIAIVTLAVGASALLPSGTAHAQEISARTLDLRIGGRLQAQVIHSSAPEGPAVQTVLRRARITFDATVNDRVDGRLQFEQGGDVKDAYVRFRLDPSLQISVGKFKRAFDLFELDSSADILVERDGRVPGVDSCVGVGGVCSWSRLSERLGYSDRDVGIRLQGFLGDRWSYMGTVTNGTGTSGDDNDGKTAAGRVGFTLADGLVLSGNLAVRDYFLDSGETEIAGAWGFDVELGGFEEDGLHFRTGFMGGANWRVLDAVDDPADFAAIQSIVSWYSSTDGDGPVAGLEPLVRISWADPDSGADDDGGLLLTPGFWVHFGDRNKMGATVDIYTPQTGDGEFSLKLFSHLYF